MKSSVLKEIPDNELNDLNDILNYEDEILYKLYFEKDNDKSDKKGHDVGVIAQEIEKVLPELVVERDSGYKAVRYEKLVPLLIQAIKELDDKVNSLS